LEGNDQYGQLCFKPGWPGQARGVWGNKQRFKDVYFNSTPGYYFTGDGVIRDHEGF
jgi:acetyl-CoA synthetase